MATNQPLKGGTNKIYSVINNFNKGIDRRTADDVAIDSTFKELKNFYNANEGVLSKRPGLYDSNFTSFLASLPQLLNNVVTPGVGDWGSNFQGVNNDFGETPDEVASKIRKFYNTVIKGEPKTGEPSTFDMSGVDGGSWVGSYTRTYKAHNIIGFQVLENTDFLEFLNKYDQIASGLEKFGSVGRPIKFGCIIAVGGYTKTLFELKNSEGVYVFNPTTSIGHESILLARLFIKITPVYNELKYDDTYYELSVEIDSVDPTTSNTHLERWFLQRRVSLIGGANLDVGEEIFIENSQLEEYEKRYKKIPLNSVDMISYNGYTYIPTGYNYIIRVKQNPDEKNYKEEFPNEADIFEVIGGNWEENLYKPTALELTQIGFNVLAQSPLDYYESTGSTSKVKGVFYSRNVKNGTDTFKQPITSVPYNDSFNLHVIYTGSTKPTSIKYRPNTGEIDESINPFKTLPGTWETNTIYVCSGLDKDQSLEIQITLGDDVFLTYLNTSSSALDETGYINEISKLVLSSTNMKLIGNQLVLYGGHGYIFFSEYDVFNYFPNYYYLYLGNGGAEEQVVGISYFRQFYAIFTNKQIKRMTGTFGADNFGVYPLNDYVGCSNGRTIKAVGNNLFFLSSDGIYQLKQGYLGEGTENVEKIDILLGDELNSSNVLEAFTLNNNYVIVKEDGKTWFIFNTETGAFYEYDLEALTQPVYNGDSKDDINNNFHTFFSIFEAKVYDKHGNFFIVPMYNYTYNADYTKATFNKMEFRIFRFSDLTFIDEDKRHSDGEGFISELETHDLHLGYPTNNKKFKDVYIKMYNDTGKAIPLYVTIWVDDKIVVNPVEYVVKYDEETDTYYYVSTLQPSKVLGEFKLGKDTLGDKNVQQIKIRVGEKGKAIKIKVSDGYDDTSKLMVDGKPKKGIAERYRNIYDFSIASIGISYKVKKVKEG